MYIPLYLAAREETPLPLGPAGVPEVEVAVEVAMAIMAFQGLVTEGPGEMEEAESWEVRAGHMEHRQEALAGAAGDPRQEEVAAAGLVAEVPEEAAGAAQQDY